MKNLRYRRQNKSNFHSTEEKGDNEHIELRSDGRSPLGIPEPFSLLLQNVFCGHILEKSKPGERVIGNLKLLQQFQY